MEAFIHSSAILKDPGTPSTILLSCGFSVNILSFMFNFQAVCYCLYVIFVKAMPLRSDVLEAHSQENVDIAMSRACQNQSRGIRAFFYVSFPIYVCFFVGPVAAILVLSSLMICLHCFGNASDANTIPSGNLEAHQYNIHPSPQSELLAEVVWEIELEFYSLILGFFTILSCPIENQNSFWIRIYPILLVYFVLKRYMMRPIRAAWEDHVLSPNQADSCYICIWVCIIYHLCLYNKNLGFFVNYPHLNHSQLYIFLITKYHRSGVTLICRRNKGP